MKLNTRRLRKQTRQASGLEAHRRVTLASRGATPSLRPQGLLTEEEFAALMAVASGQDPALTSKV